MSYADTPFCTTAAAPVTNHIRRLRSHGMTNTEIAERAGVARSTVANLMTRPSGHQVHVTLARRIKDVMPPKATEIPVGWWDDAACKDDPGPWVLEIANVNRHRSRKVDGERTRALFARQLALCAECPVSHWCVADAVQYERERRAGRHPFGIDVSIRGGLFPHEIQELVDKG